MPFTTLCYTDIHTPPYTCRFTVHPGMPELASLVIRVQVNWPTICWQASIHYGTSEWVPDLCTHSVPYAINITTLSSLNQHVHAPAVTFLANVVILLALTFLQAVVCNTYVWLIHSFLLVWSGRIWSSLVRPVRWLCLVKVTATDGTMHLHGTICGTDGSMQVDTTFYVGGDAEVCTPFSDR